MTDDLVKNCTRNLLHANRWDFLGLCDWRVSHDISTIVALRRARQSYPEGCRYPLKFSPHLKARFRPGLSFLGAGLRSLLCCCCEFDNRQYGKQTLTFGPYHRDFLSMLKNVSRWLLPLSGRASLPETDGTVGHGIPKGISWDRDEAQRSTRPKVCS